MIHPPKQDESQISSQENPRDSGFASDALIEKLRHQLAGHRTHRFGSSSESIEQLQLALETSEIAVAKMTAKLRLNRPEFVGDHQLK